MEVASTIPQQPANESATEGLKPFAVKIPAASQLLGDKARSEIYELLAAGLLDGVKDGTRTLITVASIERYLAALPPWRTAKGKPFGGSPRRRSSHTSIERDLPKGRQGKLPVAARRRRAATLNLHDLKDLLRASVRSNSTT